MRPSQLALSWDTHSRVEGDQDEGAETTNVQDDLQGRKTDNLPWTFIISPFNHLGNQGVYVLQLHTQQQQDKG